MAQDLILLAKTYSIYQFKNDSAIPDWIYASEFHSITKTKDEISVVAEQNDLISGDIKTNKDWRILKIAGPLDLSLTGIIAGISKIMEEIEIPIFTLSTYNTDYILVKHKDIETGINALREKGYTISVEK